MATRSQTDRQVRLGRILGLAFCAVGFITIIVGWSKMADRACLDCMLPYLMSAGAAALGEIIFGATLLMMASNRAERLEVEDRLVELNRQLSLLGSTMETQASSNGRVVAGRSTYHRPECRLVQGRDSLDLISVKMAEASGLSACRVCHPETADAGEPAGKP